MVILKKGETKYPKLLENIKNSPYELYVEGNEDCLNMPCITIVGSRNMTDYGATITREIVKELVKAKVCVVSGLAVGIDSVAHQTCLNYGGRTIAVLGSGFNKIYPSENKGLYKDIIKNGGCVISEYEPDTNAEKKFFPARNRIVSGLSLGTLVIEATYRSGTSITAKFALEQGRKVFCIPNKIGNKNSSGTLNLIKKGAIMITDGKEILQKLNIIEEAKNAEKLIDNDRLRRFKIFEKGELSNLDEETKKIYRYIKENKIVNSETMCNELNKDIQSINVCLSILEIKGLVLNKNGSNYVLRDELCV